MTADDSSPLIQLLDRARGGDETARDELFAQCRDYVKLVARAQVESWLRTKVDASDLVQQSLLEAHRGLERFRGTTNGEWLAWLRCIVAHNATDFARRYCATDKRQIRREIPLRIPSADESRILFGDPRDPGESPSEQMLRRERELEVARAVSELSDDYREVIMLRNLQRLSFDEVARRMERSRPAVQMLWMRAIRRLRKSIEE